MPMTDEQLALYRTSGHLTVSDVFTPVKMDEAIADTMAWGNQVLGRLEEQDQAWYLEQGADISNVLRKLDHPVFHRPVFRQLAFDEALVGMVEQLIGPTVSVYFSQIFLKAPDSGPKPAHQDNYYFGPNHIDGVVTAWIALDEATVENGCLRFADGSNTGAVLEHIAPPDEPFNLQITAKTLEPFTLTPAPVPKGGVSFHHGNTIHQSPANTSSLWRRAAAIHYVNKDTRFTNAALPYDDAMVVAVRT